VFSKLDSDSGYHQLRVLQDHIPRRAFNTQFIPVESHAIWTAIFQRMMNGILAPFLRSFAQVYLDDIIIFSVDLQTHVGVMNVEDTLDKT